MANALSKIDRPIGRQSASSPSAYTVGSLIYIRVRIDNLLQIDGAFGRLAAVAVHDAITQRAATVVGNGGHADARGSGIDIYFPVKTVAAMRARWRANSTFLEYIVDAVSAKAVEHDGHRIHAAISADTCPIELVDGEPDESRLCDAHRALEARLALRYGVRPSIEPGSQEALNYVADMAIAARVFTAMANEHLVLMWQPVMSAHGLSQHLYSEGLLRLLDPARQFDPREEFVLPGRFIPALERLGLMRALDVFVVNQTIARLKAVPWAQLGCNVSGQSAVADGWWDRVLACLDDRPSVGRRLTIEITKTAPFVSMAAAAEFVSELKERFCRVALDDVGTSIDDADAMTALGADIAKIDGRLLRVAWTTGDTKPLQDAVGVASRLAPQLVVEHVENAEMATIAGTLGIGWLQGNYVGLPSLSNLGQPDDFLDVDGVAAHRSDEVPRLAIPRKTWLIAGTLSAGMWVGIVLAARAMLH